MQSWYIDEVLCRIIFNEMIEMYRWESEYRLQKMATEIILPDKDRYQKYIETRKEEAAESEGQCYVQLYDVSSDGWTEIGQQQIQIFLHNMEVSALRLSAGQSFKLDLAFADSDKPLRESTHFYIELARGLLAKH
jgi:hypothetical protein